MPDVFADLGMSLDGFIAGPNAGPHNALGDGGARIHQWAYQLQAARERLGRSGGATDRDNEIAEEKFARAGAHVMGRRMFDEGEAGWPDPPPFGAPVFVLTHHPREPWERQGGTTFYFVTDGIDSAVEQARAAGDGKDVQLSGGGETIREGLDAGLLDELQIHLAPVVIGAGVRLFEGLRQDTVVLEPTRVVGSPSVTHIRYRVVQ
jgi:dihydrofolate reductase